MITYNIPFEDEIRQLYLNHFQIIYSCPMKTHHSSKAHICGLSKAVQNCVINNYYLGQMRCFRTKISIPVTPSNT